jgi:hypothetical protein
MGENQMRKKFVWLGGSILLFLALAVGLPAPAWATAPAEDRTPSADSDHFRKELVRGAEIDPNG